MVIGTNLISLLHLNINPVIMVVGNSRFSNAVPVGHDTYSKVTNIPVKNRIHY